MVNTVYMQKREIDNCKGVDQLTLLAGLLKGGEAKRE